VLGSIFPFAIPSSFDNEVGAGDILVSDGNIGDNELTERAR